MDTTGRVVPSPLTCAVQVRIFGGATESGRQPAQIGEYELSRRALLKTPATGGLKDMSGIPAYLPGAGNDYSYAAPVRPGVPVAVAPATRCFACHGPEGRTLFTFALEPSGVPPPVRILKSSENEHAWWVAGEKTKGKYFKALTEGWR